ncbi:MAG: D-sedoheptulose-7-phosphate isomerase [Candidatus Puniceispirillaceae bacterium]
MIKELLLASAAVKEQTADTLSEAADKAAMAITSSLKNGGKLMLCGNGGSAGDSQHLAAEFVATLDHRKPRDGLAAIALTTDTSLITAFSNDFGFDGIYDRQVQTLGKSGDVLIAISTSGNSENVIRAAKVAKEKEIFVIGMTGESGGKLGPVCDILLNVPSSVTMHIQESHIALGHAITAAVEQYLGFHS